MLAMMATLFQVNELGKYGLIIAIPLLVGLALTRRLEQTLVLVWINEMFFGGADSWSHFGFMPIRWLLLLAVFIFGFYRLLYRRKLLSSRDICVLFYGALLPSILVGYSILIRRNHAALAIADSSIYFSILGYFGLRSLFVSYPGILYGWMKAIAILVAALSLFYIFAPFPLYEHTFPLIAGKDYLCGSTAIGLNRAIFLPQAILFYGIYFAMAGCLSNKGLLITARNVLFAGFLCSPFVLTFSRGAILGICVGGIAVLSIAQIRIGKVVLFALISAGAVWLATDIYGRFLPEAVNKLRTTEVGGDELRFEQMGRLWGQFLLHPVFGAGVGSTIEGYQRDEAAGLNFEMQYNMLLAKLGATFFALIVVFPLLGFGWALARLTIWSKTSERTLNNVATRFYRDEVAVKAALLSILVEGAFNPFLTAVYTGLYITIVIAHDDGRILGNQWRA